MEPFGSFKNRVTSLQSIPWLPFFICPHFISFTCFIDLCQKFQILYWVDIFVSFLALGGILWGFSPFSIKVANIFLYIHFIMLRYVCSFLSFFGPLSGRDVELSKASSTSMRGSHNWFVSELICYIAFVILQMLNPPLHHNFIMVVVAWLWYIVYRLIYLNTWLPTGVTKDVGHLELCSS